MNSLKPMGLGEPEVVGKQSLFQPPQKPLEIKKRTHQKVEPLAETRVRMTLEITKHALGIIQNWQSKYRLETGHPIPKWKVISEALDFYDRSKKGEGSEK